MKVGNQKQAVILGIGALGALGFLGSTLFSSFGGGSAATPTEPAPPTAELKPAPLPPSEPGSEQAREASDPVRIEPAVFERDYFSQEDPDPKTAEKRLETQKRSTQNPNKRTGGATRRPKLSEFEDTDIFVPPLDGVLPNTHSESESSSRDRSEEDKTGKSDSDSPSGSGPKKPAVQIKFEGYVDAGNPVAILTIDSNRYTVDRGTRLPLGIRILAITPERITLSIKGRNHTLWLGKEVNL